MNDNINLLVTGSNGLLGQKIIDQVLSDHRLKKLPSIKLTAVSRGKNRHPIQEGYTYIDLDLLDFHALQSLIDDIQPDTIIHTAAMTNVDQCEVEPENCELLNVTLVKELVKSCERNDIHFIHLSTDFIFDGESGPYEEEDTPNPLSIYGKSKWESESSLQQAACPWTIIRTILVYGVLNDLSRSNIVLWAKNALENEQKINVVNDQWRMPTLAEDLANACLAAAIKRATGVFHVSGPDLLSIEEIVHEIADFWHLDKKLISSINTSTLNQAAARPKKTGFILNKAKTLLGYEPRSLDEGLMLVDQQLKTLKSGS